MIDCFKVKPMIYKYFSDFIKWIIAVLVLFIIAFCLSLNSQAAYGKHWLIPVCFVLANLLQCRYYSLLLKAISDKRNKRICEKTIVLKSAAIDKKYNFFNNGGAHVGSYHGRLTDTEDREFRFQTKDFMMLADENALCGVSVNVRYLEKSRILIQLRVNQAGNNETDNIKLEKFRKILIEYYGNNTRNES